MGSISLHVRGRLSSVYLETSVKMLFKFILFLVVFCFQLSKAKSQILPVFTSCACWPKGIDDDSFLIKDSLSESEAISQIEKAILEDFQNTLCERTWWFLYGWTIKCTRKPYRGIDCGSGAHIMEYSQNWYKWKYIISDDKKKKAAKDALQASSQQLIWK